MYLLKGVTMKSLSRKSTVDKVHNEAIRYLKRYSRFKHITDQPLGIIAPDKDSLITFAIENGHRQKDGIFLITNQFIRDVLHVRDSCVLGGFIIDDSILGSSYRTKFDALVAKHNLKHGVNIPNMDGLAHRDAVQLIPAKNWYAGGCISDVTLVDIKISSRGQLQPIFCSDGCSEMLHIKDNIIDTKSQHKITISGMLSGSVSGNVDGNGDTINAVLYPLRLGGGTLNINVISFDTKSSKQYRTVEGDVVDMRTIPLKGKRYVELLNWDRFTKLYDLNIEAKMDRFLAIEQTLKIMTAEGSCYQGKA